MKQKNVQFFVDQKLAGIIQINKNSVEFEEELSRNKYIFSDLVDATLFVATGIINFTVYVKEFVGINIETGEGIYESIKLLKKLDV